MKRLLLITILFVTGQTTYGLSGHEVNGGDDCEERILNIRNDIKLWINNEGSKGLRLPEELTIDDYNTKMLNKIKLAKISCVTDKITVNGAEKTCMNYIDPITKDHIIQCNIPRFNKHTSDSGQYRIVHHEYAGLAGLEVNSGAVESNYYISSQLTDFLKAELVLKLGLSKKNMLSQSDVCSRSTQIVEAITRQISKPCSKVTNLDLQRITHLNLSMKNIYTLKDGDFDDLSSLEMLDLGFNKIEKLSDRIFNDLSALESLNLSFNELTSLSEGTFNKLISLKGLWFTNNELASISEETFSELSLLEELSLASNELTNLSENTFKRTTSLTRLVLYNNNLQTIPKGLFDNLSSLTDLWMGSNNLLNLPEKIFDKLPMLKMLALSDNNLVDLSEGVFDKLYSITEIAIFRNHLDKETKRRLKKKFPNIIKL